MLSTMLINLYSNMSASANYSAILPITPPATFPATVVFTLFALATFIKYKNLFLETLGLTTGRHVTTNSALIISIYDYLFTS